ncbi:helix-turn-helix domain-containing protein [Paenibacillus lautus]|uniref:helix-turn-helix domain-containing protein n=1 Tax=Paenibacillus lautus TaxID=1401 RepID=UPI003D291B3D
MNLNRLIDMNNWYIRLMLPFALLVTLALSAGWLIYRQTLSLVGEEARNINMHMLEQVTSTLDGRLAEIDTIVMQVANDPKLVQLQQLKDPFEGTNTFKLLSAQKGLYNFSNKFILNYMIYYRNSDIIVAPSKLYKADAFYELVLNYNDLPYDKWHKDFFEDTNCKRFLKAMPAIFKNKTHSIITYSYPLGSIPGLSQGSVVVLIDNDQVLKLLTSLVDGNDGWAYIEDDQGNVISSIGNYIQLDTDIWNSSPGISSDSFQLNGYMVTHTRSSENGWHYVVAQPPHVVLAKVDYIKRITLSTALLFLVIGIVLAYFFTSRNSRKVAYMLDSNRTLQEELKKQEPLLLASFMERLLKGDIVNGSFTESMMKHLHISQRISSVAAAIVQIIPRECSEENRLKEVDRLRVLLKGVHRTCPEGTVHFYDATEDTIVLLFMEPDKMHDKFILQMESLFVRMKDVMAPEPYVSLNFAAGGIYTSLIDVSRSYGEAKQTLNYLNRHQHQGIKWFHQLPDLSDSHYFPSEIEIRLMNNAKIGNKDEVNLLLNEIYEQNFHIRNLSMPIQKLLLYDMAGSLIKLKEQLSLEDESDIHPLLHQMIDTDNPAEVFRFVRQSYVWILDQLQSRKKSGNAQLLQNIQRYIQLQFENPNLNLDTIADEVGISRVYFSKFFKEQTGTNFSDYLESIRMEKACAMLRETLETVSDIAKQTGYSSTNTFSRAFKRIHGISPSSYRDHYSQ